MRIIVSDKIKILTDNDTIVVSSDIRKWHTLLKDKGNSSLNIAKKGMLKIAAQYNREMQLYDFNISTNANVIVTGHQANWHSPGVWIKTSLANQLAKITNSVAVQLVLDHDIYGIDLEVPKVDNEGRISIHVIKIEQDNPSKPIEYRKLIKNLKHEFDSKLHLFKDTLFGEVLHEVCAEQVCQSPTQMTTLIQAKINEKLSMKILYLPVSKISQTKTFLNFVTEIIKNSKRFNSIYNKFLETNPQINAIKKLKITPATELPFWIISSNSMRHSLSVNRKNEAIGFYADENFIGTTQSSDVNSICDFLTERGLQIRPKAIALTLFARLYLADLFIHGVGGSKYEPLTEHIICNFYDVKPAAYVSATMTSYLFKEVCNQDFNAEIKSLKNKLRDLSQNPQKYIDAENKDSKFVDELIKEKFDILNLLNCTEISISQKSDATKKIKEINAKLIGFCKDSKERINIRIEDCKNRKNEQSIFNSRTYFVGLYNKTVLMQAIYEIDKVLKYKGLSNAKCFSNITSP